VRLPGLVEFSQPCGCSPHRCGYPRSGYWFTEKCSHPRRALLRYGDMGISCQYAIYVESVVPPAEVWIPAGLVEVELREPPVRMQPRRATDRLAPLAISLAACW